MRVKKLHQWNLSCSQAVALQRKLAGSVRIAPVRKKAALVAGLDCSFARDDRGIVAAVVVLSLHNLELVETATALRKLVFAYIPGLLSFREAPACIAAVEKLRSEPDLFIVDGQGIAHPRRLGLAAHLGLFFDKPTIGCAKSRLVGTFEEPGSEKGEYAFLKDNDQTIGAVLRTRTAVKPVFVSVGNNCTLKGAIKTVLACTTRYRLPEPLRLAHQLAGKAKVL